MDMDNGNIGLKIRTLRKSTNTTLETLARRTGFTKGYLSKVERGLQSPPIATLSKIAGALNVEIADFFERQQAEVKCAVVRRDQRKTIAQRGSIFGYHYESLAYTKHNKAMNPFVITMIPEADDHTFFRHEGQELMFVLEGSIEFLYDDQRHVLEAGDCVYFDSEVPHRGQGLGKTPSKVLAVIYSPQPARRSIEED